MTTQDALMQSLADLWRAHQRLDAVMLTVTGADRQALEIAFAGVNDGIDAHEAALSALACATIDSSDPTDGMTATQAPRPVGGPAVAG